MGIISLQPYRSEKIWGYEDWQFSTHPNGETRVQETGMPLSTYFGVDLPIMIKYIVANETLSVQVHPDDAYAKAHTTDRGKTECWYITQATPGAKLIFGLEKDVTKADIEQALKQGTIESYLTYVDVAAGDMLYIPAGTVHAIMGGLELLEIQQSSDTTYRLYDWGRDRQIHIKESLDVIDYGQTAGAMKIPADEFTALVTPYFEVHAQHIVDEKIYTTTQAMTMSVVSGVLTMSDSTKTYTLTPYETLYIEADTPLILRGEATVLLTTWE